MGRTTRAEPQGNRLSPRSGPRPLRVTHLNNLGRAHRVWPCHPTHQSNRPRPEGVALGKPARAGRAHREAPVGDGVESRAKFDDPSWLQCVPLLLRHNRKMTVAFPEDMGQTRSFMHGSGSPSCPKDLPRGRTYHLLRPCTRRIAPKLFGSHGQRPWIYS